MASLTMLPSQDRPPAGRRDSGMEELLRELHQEEDGLATAEYGIVMLAAVGFAGLLVAVLSSGEVREMLAGIVQRALTL
ncbi:MULTISPECIES: DUF4244 domain-containing protein [Actinomycetes]|nr:MULTISPECIES: DUF4244 domain-containing protein [unclassified Nesterenkonia]MDS2171107.1 DUF4244 domain-containing protein [Nesterenkonia sp. CL21]OSM44097.1 hypothetical protein BCY76_004520 [Nesterenkonia sp. PF2B19]